jgi:parallel beta-helix repeat protein
MRRSCRNTVRKNKLDYGIRIKPREVHARDSTCVLIETGSNDNRFRDNSCTHGGDGIFIRVLDGWVSTGNRFERNDCSYANNNCFEAWSPRNVYIGNKANHGSYGFWLGASDQTVLVDNEASFNGEAKGNHNSPHLPQNGHAGIVFMFGPSSHTIVRGNKCIGNNGAGIVLIGDIPTRGKAWKAFHWIIEQNTLAGNRWGIYAQHADWLDLAANLFKDNKVENVHLDNVTNVTRRPDNPKINQPPKAVVTGPAGARVGQSVVLDASASRDPAGNPLLFRWDLGDGTIARTAWVEHVFKKPGFYRVGVTVNNGLLADLGWRDFYVVDEREQPATEGQASHWTFQDDWQRSKVAFTDDKAVKIAGMSSLHAEVNPYSGARLRLLYPEMKNADWSVKGKTHLAFWLKVVKEHPWQDANPEITLYETDKKFVRLVPRREVLGNAVNEAREGWWYVVVPLAGDDVWQRQGPTLETINYLSIGFDTWEHGPLRIWVDGLRLQ